MQQVKLYYDQEAIPSSYQEWMTPEELSIEAPKGYSGWRRFVRWRILKELKYVPDGETLQDVLQYVWMKILEKDVLGKFEKPPLEKVMTTRELSEALGVSSSQMDGAIRRAFQVEDHRLFGAFDMVDAPRRKDGSPMIYSRRAKVRVTNELLVLLDGYFVNRWSDPRPSVFMVEIRGFLYYVSKVVYNCLANWYRTRSRHFDKEAPRVCLLADSDSSGHSCDASWEDLLVYESNHSLEKNVEEVGMALRGAGLRPPDSSESGAIVDEWCTVMGRLGQLGYGVDKSARKIKKAIGRSTRADSQKEALKAMVQRERALRRA